MFCQSSESAPGPAIFSSDVPTSRHSHGCFSCLVQQNDFLTLTSTTQRWALPSSSKLLQHQKQHAWELEDPPQALEDFCDPLRPPEKNSGDQRKPTAPAHTHDTTLKRTTHGTGNNSHCFVEEKVLQQEPFLHFHVRFDPYLIRVCSPQQPSPTNRPTPTTPPNLNHFTTSMPPGRKRSSASTWGDVMSERKKALQISREEPRRVLNRGGVACSRRG